MPVPVGTRSQHYALYMQDSGQGTRLQLGEFELYYAAPSPPPNKPPPSPPPPPATPPDTDCPYLDSLDSAHAACDAVDGCDAIDYNEVNGATCFKQCGGAYAFTAQTAPGTWLASIRAACTPPLAPPPSPGLPPGAAAAGGAAAHPARDPFFFVASGDCQANTGAAPYCVCSPNYDDNCLASLSNLPVGSYSCTFSAPPTSMDSSSTTGSTRTATKRGRSASTGRSSRTMTTY